MGRAKKKIAFPFEVKPKTFLYLSVLHLYGHTVKVLEGYAQFGLILVLVKKYKRTFKKMCSRTILQIDVIFIFQAHICVFF